MPGHRARRAISAAAMMTLAVGLLVHGENAASAAAAPTCTSTWIGARGAAWSDPTNWSPAGVPVLASTVCVLTAAGPTVGTAHVTSLYARGTTITITKSLVANSYDIAGSSLSGRGAFGSNKGGALSGVLFSASVTVNAGRDVSLTGTRSMCGGQLALCLNGSSRLVGSSVTLSGGDIGGTSTAAPPLTAKQFFVTDPTADGSDRIGVPLAAGQVFNDTTATNPASLVLIQWDGYAADGTLTGRLTPGAGGIVVPGPIITISGTGYLIGTNVTTPDGQFAAAGLVRNDGFMSISTDVTIAPTGGTLFSTGVLAFFSKSPSRT